MKTLEVRRKFMADLQWQQFIYHNIFHIIIQLYSEPALKVYSNVSCSLRITQLTCS